MQAIYVFAYLNPQPRLPTFARLYLQPHRTLHQGLQSLPVADHKKTSGITPKNKLPATGYTAAGNFEEEISVSNTRIAF